jgi:hypothetical protein
MSGHADDLGGAECIEAVEEGYADLDLSGLAFRVSCSDALAEGFEAAHSLPGSGLSSNHERQSRPRIAQGANAPLTPHRLRQSPVYVNVTTAFRVGQIEYLSLQEGFTRCAPKSFWIIAAI